MSDYFLTLCTDQVVLFTLYCTLCTVHIVPYTLYCSHCTVHSAGQSQTGLSEVCEPWQEKWSRKWAGKLRPEVHVNCSAGSHLTSLPTFSSYFLFLPFLPFRPCFSNFSSLHTIEKPIHLSLQLLFMF